MTAFEVLPGTASSPVVIHVPHASRVIPPDVRRGILLSDVELEAELDAMTDAFTDVLASVVFERAAVRPWVFVNRMSRLVVDPERFPDEREEMAAVGMGAVYTRTSDGRPLRAADPSLVERYFGPYAAALGDLVDERLEDVERVCVIDLHSYPLHALPYELHGEGPRPEVCLGTDPFHTDADLLDTARWAFADFELGLDSPFAGTYVSERHWRRDDRVRSLMVELRRDLYLDGTALVEPALEPIATALTSLVEALSPLVSTITCHGMGDVEVPRFEG